MTIRNRRTMQEWAKKTRESDCIPRQRLILIPIKAPIG